MWEKARNSITSPLAITPNTIRRPGSAKTNVRRGSVASGLADERNSSMVLYTLIVRNHMRLIVTSALLLLSGCTDRSWCYGDRIAQANVVRECLKIAGCKTTPEDLWRMHRIESRCSQFNGT